MYCCLGRRARDPPESQLDDRGTIARLPSGAKAFLGLNSHFSRGKFKFNVLLSVVYLLHSLSIPVSLAIMAPEILGVSPPVDNKLVKKVVIETLASLDASNTTPIRSNLAPLFQENTLAKLLGAAEVYLENNVCSTVSL